MYERDTEDDFYNRPRDWGMSLDEIDKSRLTGPGMLLHWGAEFFEKLLPDHLRERIKEIRCDPYLDTTAPLPPVPFVNALTGEITAQIPLSNTNRVSRKKLRRFLTEGEDINIFVSPVTLSKARVIQANES